MFNCVFQAAIKRKLEDEPDWTARRSYDSVVGLMSVQAAAVTVPLMNMERSLQRHKYRNRPPLPQTRQDLVLGQQYMSTNDGRPFVLIDDGNADRILVFGTAENLRRLEKLKLSGNF